LIDQGGWVGIVAIGETLVGVADFEREPGDFSIT